MAGHSKWANIKHKKAKVDAKRGKAFSRIVKEIISAVKIGGPDAKSNPRLRLVVQKAKAANMAQDTIEKNIKKASDPDQSAFEEATYELYGYGGVGLLVDILTDNKNRTASDMRIATNKRGGSIGTPGSVAFNFDRKGIIEVERHKALEEELFSLAIDSGAEDFEVGDHFVIITEPTDLHRVEEGIEKAGIEMVSCEMGVLPKTTVACSEEDKAKNIALIEWREDLDDVNEVHHNMELA